MPDFSKEGFKKKKRKRCNSQIEALLKRVTFVDTEV